MTARLTLFFVAALVYATLRYNIFGGVPWAQWPVWVTNKAVSLAALAAIAASYVARRPGWPRRLGIAGSALTALHIAMSLALLDAAHYPKILTAGGWTTPGIASHACGTAAMLAMLVPLWATRKSVRARLGEHNWSVAQRFGLVLLFLSAVHVGAIGFAGWTSPSSWPGFLPPITMISAAIALWPLVLRGARRVFRRAPSRREPESTHADEYRTARPMGRQE